PPSAVMAIARYIRSRVGSPNPSGDFCTSGAATDGMAPAGISDLIMPTRFPSLTLLTVALVLVSRVYSQTDQNQLPALMAEAKRAQTAGDVDSAIEAYAKILRFRPNWGPAEFNLGLMYHLQKKYEQAVP